MTSCVEWRGHTLEFIEEGHQYRIDGRTVRSVTQILSLALGDPYRGISEGKRIFALDRGRAVHGWTAQDDRGLLNKENEPKSELMQGYLASWRRCRKEAIESVLEVEEPVFSTKYWYAGTLDRVVVVKGDKYILDIKTGLAVHPYCHLQTMLYQMAWDEMHHPMKIWGRMTVLLTAHGDYQIHKHERKQDRQVALAILTVVGERSRLKVSELDMEVL